MKLSKNSQFYNQNVGCSHKYLTLLQYSDGWEYDKKLIHGIEKK